MSPEQSEENEPARAAHWTDTHPDKDFWTPGQLSAARTQTQEEYEALYGRGPEVEHRDGASTKQRSAEPNAGPVKRQPGRVHPPRLFRDVAGRLGIQPLDRPPSPPRIPLEGPVDPDDLAPDFWDQEVEGGAFGDAASWQPGLPEQLGEPPVIDELAEAPPRLRSDQGHSFTADAIAYYHPWHAGGDQYWGIYFRERNMNAYIERVERMFGWAKLRDVITEQVLQHEMEHFEQEKSVFLLEDILDQGDLHSRWAKEREHITVDLFDKEKSRGVAVRMIQEALATAREIDWAKRQERTGLCPPGYADFLDWDFRSGPPGYRDFYLCVGQSQRREGLAAFLESVGSVALPNPIPRITGEAATSLFGVRTAASRGKVPIYVVNN